MALRSMLEKGADVELLREMIGFAVERLMELEVVALTGASHGERSPDRLVLRNGDRDWQTRAGIVELWSLQALVGRDPIPVKVILRREGGDQVYFWSVMGAYREYSISNVA
jgi:hypothetical protein